MQLLHFTNTWLLRAASALLTVALAIGLSACGQKGALYLPEDSTAVVAPAPLPDQNPPTLKDNTQNPNVDSPDVIDQQTPQDDENAY